MQKASIPTRPFVRTSSDLRQLATRYISEHVGGAFTVSTFKLQHDQKRWWALIQYQAPGHCRPIGVGRLEVDAQTGQVIPLQHEEINMIAEKAALLEAKQPTVAPVNAEGYVLGEYARKQASRYLWDHLSMHFGAAAPHFLPDDPPQWQLTIVFSMYPLGPFSVGMMKVAAETGEPVPLTQAEIKQLKERVYAIVGSRPSPAKV
jgi:hypothetical protein